jgi:thioesterase domain-containing protein
MRGRAPATDVERMASDTVATIARYYPSGPLRIAGYSAAGLVAYEAARQLRKAGRTVLEVMIIGFGAENVAFTGLDALLRRAGLSHASRAAVLRRAMYIGFRLRRTATSSPREQWQRVRRFLERKPKAPAPRNHVEAEFSALLGPYYRAHDTYIPRPYDGRVTLIWPTEQPFDNGDPRAHWSRVAPDLTLAFVPGTHDTAVSRYVADIADIMRR